MNDFKLPIYHALYGLVRYLYKIVQNMPREYKYSIGQDILELSWHCLDLTMDAAKNKKDTKTETIDELSREFDRLKLRLRMASEVGILNENCFAHLQKNYLAEAGKMIGGWQKWSKGLKEFEI